MFPVMRFARLINMLILFLNFGIVDADEGRSILSQRTGSYSKIVSRWVKLRGVFREHSSYS
jgi:hypothetical protein